MYTEYIWEFLESMEHEMHYAGKYGAKGEKRAPREKKTPEAVAKQNQINRVNRMRRLIKANFRAGDIWITLKYPAGTRKPIKEVAKDVSKFHRRVREQYRIRGEPYKFIIRFEIGRYGGIHIHILLNRIRDTDLIVDKAWSHHENFEPYEGTDEAAERLANYLCKVKEEYRYQLNLFEGADRDKLVRVSSSRNLIRPAPKKKVFSHWTMRRILLNGPKATKGFRIREDTIQHGTNQYTGMSWYRYTEVRVARLQI